MKKWEIHITWHIDDIRYGLNREDLSWDEALSVLQYAKKNHDASFGINWDVLEDIADTLYPKRRGDIKK